MSTNVMPVISIDINLFWQIINFFILMLVFNKFFKKPLKKILEERKTKILNDLKSATEEKEKAIIASSEAEEVLIQARFKASEIIKRAELKADETKESIVNDAKDRRDKMLQAAELDIIKMKNYAKKELEKEVTGLAVKLAEKLIKKEIDSKLEADLINDFIERVGEADDE